MMPKSEAINLTDIRSDPNKFLKAVLDGLIYDGFRFPVSGVDGCVGTNCISKSLVVSPPQLKARISFHLNFMCTPGKYDGTKLNLKIDKFHLTARPLANQALINVAGPSLLTARESIHINRNTTWGRPENLESFATSLGTSVSNAKALLTQTEGYTQDYMRLAVNGLKQAITTTAGINAGSLSITWDGSDKTFD